MIVDPGTFVEHDGRPAVRFERRYPHPAETVWAAVTEPAHLAHWFPSTVELEPRPGGRVVFDGDPNGPAATGTVLAWEPPHRLAFTWGDEELHLAVEVRADGTALVLLHVLATDDTAARSAAGWAVCLDELDKHVAGDRADGPHSPSATAWRPLYDQYVAAGLPSGAPIPTGGG